MKLIALKGIRLSREEAVAPGDKIEVDEALGMRLIASGKAAPNEARRRNKRRKVEPEAKGDEEGQETDGD